MPVQSFFIPDLLKVYTGSLQHDIGKYINNTDRSIVLFLSHFLALIYFSCSENFVRVEVFFDEIKRTEIIESPAYGVCRVSYEIQNEQFAMMLVIK